MVDLGEMPEDEGMEVTRDPSPPPTQAMFPSEALDEVSEGEADASAALRVGCGETNKPAKVS